MVNLSGVVERPHSTPALALLILACLCLWAMPVKANDPPLQPVSLQLKWAHQFQFAGFYAAKAKGYYTEAGLDVTIKERTPGLDVANEVLSGRADIGVGDASLVLDYFNGKAIVALGCIFQHSPHILLSRSSSDITSPADLRGKRVMLLGTTAAPQRAMLVRQGVRLNELTLQPLSWSTDALINGETDAMAAYLTTEPYAMKQAGVPANIMRPRNYGIDFYGDTLFTSQHVAKAHTKMVEAFLQASYRGWAYAMDHSEEIIGLIQSKYSSDKNLGQLRYEASAMRELVLPGLVEIGSMNKLRWERIAATFHSLGMIDKTWSLDDFLYIPEAQQRLLFLARWTPVAIAVVIIGLLASLVLLILNRRLKRNVRRQNRDMERNRENQGKVINLVPNMIYVKNGQGQFLLLNRATAKFLGSSVDRLTGATHTEVHHDAEDASRMNNADLEVIRTGLPKATMEEPFRHADGSTRWLQSTRLPFSLAGTDEPAVLTLCVDITRRREAERAIKENEERFRAIFNQTYQLSGILNLHGDIIQINQTALKAFDLKEQDILGHPLTSAPWWDRDKVDLDWLNEAIPQAARGETCQRCLVHLRPDGSVMDVDFTLKPARNDEGDIVFLIAEGRDVTKQRESEDELKRLNEELEQRVADRTRNLEEAKAELVASIKELNKTQEELVMSEKMAALGGLVAGVAHEINTPLGVGVTACSFLDERLQQVENLFEKNELKRSDLERFLTLGRESCDNIMTNLSRAAELIRSFKQVATDQSSEISRPFNLKSYVDEVLLSLKPKYKRTDHVIENSCPDITIHSYPGVFMQIVTNLLLNSLTHGYAEGEYGHIRIGGNIEGNTLTMTFEDDGHGIPSEAIDKVFEPFYTTRRGKGGTGLGLHIVYNTVTRTLGGTIRLESKEGRGTHYTITMPIEHAKPEMDNDRK